jgi:hypothetical protein
MHRSTIVGGAAFHLNICCLSLSVIRFKLRTVASGPLVKESSTRLKSDDIFAAKDGEISGCLHSRKILRELLTYLASTRTLHYDQVSFKKYLCISPNLRLLAML